jgi:propionyl-CoA carboxylase alpha chain
MFTKILIANRGEIAVRIIKTARRLGVATVVACSDADADSLAVEMADEAVRIGPAPARESYLVAERIIEAARATGAEAVHPGYGFLAENPAFARALEAAGIVFIGPRPDAMAALGDKIASKTLAGAAGVNVIPGHDGEIADPTGAVKAARAIGYPVMLKASAGGGGRGMRVARTDKELREAFASARNEAKAAFGDPRLLLEKLIEEPRHIEIQVLGDKHGNVIHLGERECSIQRRNQKVIEESPSPALDGKLRRAMAEQALALAKAVGYDSAGTVELILDTERNFYFLEMNTRLQVEHPVTELVTGLDLVEEMLRVAAGEPLRHAQKDVKLQGWAIETRLCAEDPTRGFLPSVGRLKRFRPPAEAAAGGAGTVRVDTGVREGDAISIHYDSLIAKLVAHGPDRAAAIAAMGEMLDVLEVDGVETNAAFLAAVVAQERFRAGRLSTAYIGEEFPQGFAERAPRAEELPLFLAAAAYAGAFEARRAGAGERAAWTVALDGVACDVEIALEPEGARVRLPGEEGARALATAWRPGQRIFQGRLDGAPFALSIAPTLEGWTLARRGASATAIVAPPRSAALRARLPERAALRHSRGVVSPMPGLVSSIAVAAGQAVKIGEALLVVEAMKMENVVRAERDGVVKAVHVAAGASVAADELLVELE